MVNEFGELGIDGELLRSCQICPDRTEANIVELTMAACAAVKKSFANDADSAETARHAGLHFN